MQVRKKMLLKKRVELLKKIELYADFIKGSVSRITRKGNLTSGYNITGKDENQKTLTKYISEKQLKPAQKSIKSMNKVRKLIDKISQINIEILKQS